MKYLFALMAASALISLAAIADTTTSTSAAAPVAKTSKHQAKKAKHHAKKAAVETPAAK